MGFRAWLGGSMKNFLALEKKLPGTVPPLVVVSGSRFLSRLHHGVGESPSDSWLVGRFDGSCVGRLSFQHVRTWLYYPQYLDKETRFCDDFGVRPEWPTKG